MEQNEKRGNARKVGGLLFVGCMFIGIAIGNYMGNPGMGTMGGMGLGFIMMAVVYLSEANKK
jgi:hypothetical protein